MRLLLNKIVRLFNQFRGLFPSRLPQGMTEFDAWVKSIAATYDLPSSSTDDMKNSFAAMIMHSGPTAASRPKYYFVLAFRAAAAKQVAHAVFMEIRQKAAEATAPVLKAVANESQKPSL